MRDERHEEDAGGDRRRSRNHTGGSWGELRRPAGSEEHDRVEDRVLRRTQRCVRGLRRAAPERHEINAKGGLGGYTIKIVSKDNKGDQTQTATTTQELLDQGIKIFVITTGDTAVAGGQLAVQGGAIASVGGNTAPEIV